MGASAAKEVLDGILGYRIDASTRRGKTISNEDLVPGIPPLALCAIALWVGAAASYYFSEALDCDFERACIAAASIACLSLAITCAIKRSLTALVLLFSMLGCLLGLCASYGFNVDASQIPESGECILTLEDDPKKSSRGSYADATCETSSGRQLKVRAFFGEDQPLYSGAKMQAKCSFSESSQEFAHSNYISGICMQANASDCETLELPFLQSLVYSTRAWAIDTIAAHGGDQAGLLQALLCGYRPTIQEDGHYEEFKKCGIAHIVAVSGAHLAIVTMSLAVALKILRIRKVATVILTLLFVSAYLLFAGVPISALRAATMCSLSIVSGLTRRRNATLNSLAVCIILFIALDTTCAVSISLFLSAASTFGIVLFSRIFSTWSQGLPAIAQDVIAAPLSTTISSNVVTLPFSAAIFKMVPLISPVANVAITPIFTLACNAGLAALLISAIIPAAAPACIGVASAIASPMNVVASTLSDIPHAYLDVSLEPIPMLLLSGCLAVFLIAKKPRIKFRHFAIAGGAFVLAFAISGITIPRAAGDRIVMLDVGQGDAVAIQSEGQTLLIDTGNKPSSLKESLKHAGIAKIDAVSISHPDSDHCDAMGELEVYPPDAKFICATDMVECGCAKCENLISEAEGIFGRANILGVSVGDAFNIGNFRIDVLSPSSYANHGDNDDSLCLLASLDCDDDGIDDWRALFTGDAESSVLEKVIGEGLIGDIDVLKVGHHGSRDSVSDRALSVLKPEYALISVGNGNTYGHPTKDTLDALERADTQILRTDESGVVEVAFTKENISASKQRG